MAGDAVPVSGDGGIYTFKLATGEKKIPLKGLKPIVIDSQNITKVPKVYDFFGRWLDCKQLPPMAFK